MVTGGAGYIGSVVCEELARDGHDVVIYDDLRKGHREMVPEGTTLVRADLGDIDTLRDALGDHRIDGVIHMAADSLVGESVQQPRKYYTSNVRNSLNLLDAMADLSIRRVVFSSSAAVYGEPERQPISEDMPAMPTNPYGETKLALERALHWYSQAYELRYASLRYFNAAGASERCGELHDPETHLIPIVLDVAAGRRDHVTIFGDDYPTRDGTCVRDYIHVIDLARAHVLALGIESERNAIYNLGCGGDGYTVKEVIDVAREVTGRAIAVETGPRRPGDPPVLIASSEKIRRELGWEPRFQDLRLIVESAWRWMQRQRLAPADGGEAASSNMAG